jgi:CHAD domain-containing protein
MSSDKQPIEIELKLILPDPGAEASIVEHLRAQGYKVKQLKAVQNVDIYLDTFDWSLLKKKLALRYRLADGVAMYALKSVGEIEAGIARRMEIEAPLSEPCDEPTDIQVKQIQDMVGEIISPRKLLEHIQIRTNRRRYRLLSPEGAKIELAFDAANFSLRGLHPPRRTRILYELEAELLDGPASAVVTLASFLSHTFGYQPSTASKLEVAIKRFNLSLPGKKLPEKYTVRPDDRLDLAVRKILASQLNRFLEQLPGLLRDIDTEFLHQARVSTRRMRSALRLFREVVPQSTGIFLAGELQWLGGMLGAVRDLDVFLLNLPRFQEQIERFPVKKKKVFEQWIRERRLTPLASLIQALTSKRYVTFERRCRHFLEGPLAIRPRAPLARKRVRDLAPAIINEKFEAVVAQGHKVINNPQLKEFHRLRIQMKKLRYACEFMAPAYDGALDAFIERTVAVQDCLGEIQDAVFTKDFIDNLFEEWKSKLVGPELVFILGELYQLQRAIADERQGKFGKIWERFASAETVGQMQQALDLPQQASAMSPAVSII